MTHIPVLNALPCSSCKSECCGPVPLTEARLGEINQHLQGLGREEVRRLSRQKRSALTCKFVDTQSNTCAIYPVRPQLCRIYGRVEKMICPKVGRVVDPLPQIVAEMAVDKEYLSGAVMVSTDFDWERA